MAAIQKHCVEAESRCTQCRGYISPRRKTPRRCPLYKELAAHWPELREFLHSEIDRLTKENEDLRLEVEAADNMLWQLRYGDATPGQIN